MPFVVEVVRCYLEPRASARRILARADTEGRALAILVLGCFVLFLSQLPDIMSKEVAQGGSPGPVADAAARIVGALVFAPLLFYGIAGLTGLAIRAAGYSLSWINCRVSLFWAVLAVSPAVLIIALARGFIGTSALLIVISLAMTIPFLVIWISALLESIVADRELAIAGR